MAALSPSVTISLLEGDDQTDKVLSTLTLEDLMVTEAEAKVLNDDVQAMDTDGESKDSPDVPKSVVTEQVVPPVPVEEPSKVGFTQTGRR